jgi:hypothetical protein
MHTRPPLHLGSHVTWAIIRPTQCARVVGEMTRVGLGVAIAKAVLPGACVCVCGCRFILVLLCMVET